MSIIVGELQLKHFSLSLMNLVNWGSCKTLLTKVILPKSLPEIYEILRIELGAAWGLVILAEIVREFGSIENLKGRKILELGPGRHVQ